MKFLINALLLGSVLILSASLALAKDKALLDALSAEADNTSMEEDTSLDNTDSEPSSAPEEITDYDALEKKIAGQIKGVLKDSDKDKKFNDKLENIVSSALLRGNKMNDIRSAVTAAMTDIKKTSVKAGNASNAIIKSVGKALENIVAEKKVKPAKIAAKVAQTRSTIPDATILANTVTVLKGESLYKIAQRVYGSGSKYLELYNANRDVLSDPNMISAGQILKVP
ncbi:MAG TPA: LysM peptidoglycan-binding domain-containing protein [Leucothrix mucor]|uniref:LysM peptidoglycan-binding domain-containing protein n=1 Tax=Leucothrix mucor TaxID=45248 RepID=A0A7V2SYH8_LEUMU|nr:LysM peptidoglycan-binding domain-containing protein [Leucothrix mucor]